MPDDPVTLWLNQLREADDAAARSLWRHFVGRLYDLARSKLSPSTRRVYDEEDVAQSAFHSVCIGIKSGRFPDLQDRDSLLGLLLVVTSRKISFRHRHDQQQRRDVRRNLSSVVFSDTAYDDAIKDVGQLVAHEPTPDFAVEFMETFETLFKSLDDQSLQDVVALRMEGYTDSEVAKQLKCSRRTVQRRLVVIRRHWSRLELSGE